MARGRKRKIPIVERAFMMTFAPGQPFGPALDMVIENEGGTQREALDKFCGVVNTLLKRHSLCKRKKLMPRNIRLWLNGLLRYTRQYRTMYRAMERRHYLVTSVQNRVYDWQGTENVINRQIWECAVNFREELEKYDGQLYLIAEYIRQQEQEAREARAAMEETSDA